MTTEEEHEQVEHTDGQVELFPEEAKIRRLHQERATALSSIRAAIQPIAKHGGYFSVLSKYAALLEEHPSDDSDQLLGENLSFAIIRCESLRTTLERATELLETARKLQSEIEQLERIAENPPTEAPDFQEIEEDTPPELLDADIADI